jgi:hypothetical protein
MARTKRTGDRIEIVQRTDGRWNWHVVSRNGNIVDQGAEGDGFPTASAARRQLRTVRRLLARIDLPVVVLKLPPVL